MITTSIDEFNLLLNLPHETEKIEFKEAKNQYDQKSLFEYCVGIANEGGGKLILGITNQIPRKVVGTNSFPHIQKISSTIFNKIRFRVDVEEFKHPDGRVLIFHIPSRPTGSVYDFEGRYLQRVGEQLLSMSPDRLRTIFEEGKPDWLSQLAIEKCNAEDVVRLLDTQIYFDLINQPYPSTRSSTLERFESEKLVKKCSNSWAITNLGAVLFGKDLHHFDHNLRRKAVRLIVYDATNKLKTNYDLHEAKGYVVGFEGLIDFVIGLLPTSEVIERAIREQVNLYPAPAIRELVANAIIHQDFSQSGSSIKIELFSDRIEISNPGIPSIDPDRFIDEYQSRNEVLSDLMRRLGICEEKGSGIDRVVHYSEVFQLPAPDFRASEIHTVAILFSPVDFSEMSKNDRIRACYQHCCLKYVNNERMTNQSLRERFKLSEKKSESISRLIRDTMSVKKIKNADPSVISTRYRSYIPHWA